MADESSMSEHSAGCSFLEIESRNEDIVNGLGLAIKTSFQQPSDLPTGFDDRLTKI